MQIPIQLNQCSTILDENCSYDSIKDSYNTINEENYLQFALRYAELKDHHQKLTQINIIAEKCLDQFIKKHQWSFSYYCSESGLPKIRVEKEKWNENAVKELQILIECKLVEGLIFSGDFFNIHPPQEQIFILKNLKILMLEKMEYNESLFHSIAQSCTNLRSLILCHQLDDATYALPFAKNLKEITFMSGYYKKSETVNIDSFVKLLKEHPSIQSLKIQNACAFNNEHFNKLAPACSNLTQLYFNNVDIKASALQSILKHCNKLQDLSLMWCDNLMDEALDHLVDYLKDENCQLKNLNIEGSLGISLIKKCQTIHLLYSKLNFKFK